MATEKHTHTHNRQYARPIQITSRAQHRRSCGLKAKASIPIMSTNQSTSLCIELIRTLLDALNCSKSGGETQNEGQSDRAGTLRSRREWHPLGERVVMMDAFLLQPKRQRTLLLCLSSLSDLLQCAVQEQRYHEICESNKDQTCEVDELSQS